MKGNGVNVEIVNAYEQWRWAFEHPRLFTLIEIMPSLCVTVGIILLKLFLFYQIKKLYKKK